MRRKRGAIGPLLDKHEPQRILAIDMHGMRDASRLRTRAMHVFEAECADIVERILPRRHPGIRLTSRRKAERTETVTSRGLATSATAPELE